MPIAGRRVGAGAGVGCEDEGGVAVGGPYVRAKGLAVVCDRSSCAVVRVNEKEPELGKVSQIELFAVPVG